MVSHARGVNTAVKCIGLNTRNHLLTFRPELTAGRRFRRRLRPQLPTRSTSDSRNYRTRFRRCSRAYLVSDPLRACPIELSFRASHPDVVGTPRRNYALAAHVSAGHAFCSRASRRHATPHPSGCPTRETGLRRDPTRCPHSPPTALTQSGENLLR